MAKDNATAGPTTEEIELTPLGKPPKFFSLEFHKDFFPEVLRQVYLRRKKQSLGYQSPFANHNHPEVTILIVLCVVLAVIGLPSLINRHSLSGGIMAVLGLGGFSAMFISSLRSVAGQRYSFNDFSPAIFLFFLMIGITAGLSAGFISESRWLGIYGSILGLIVGYIAGIYAGVGINYLGWIGTYLVYLVFMAMFWMGIMDLILIYGLFFKGA